MIRFCDKEVCCISYEELERGMLLHYFFQGNMDEMVCVLNTDGTYCGRITYYSLINCDRAEEAVLEDFVILNKDFWKHAREFFVNYERSIGEYALLPVVDEKKQLISFAYEDGDANRELRMLKELEELSGGITFAEVYPQYDCVKICGFNELSLRFAEYLRKQNICVETDGELWERFIFGGGKAEAPDYKRLVLYAEGVEGARSENWVENLLRSVSPEFECIDCIYEANWKEGKVRDTETDIVGLLEYLRTTHKEIAILGIGIEAQNVYDFLLCNGIEADYFVSNLYEEREHLLFGKRILKSSEVWNRRERLILLDYKEKNSALGNPKLEEYSNLGFQRNRDLFFLKDYAEIPFENLRHSLKNQKILFVGDILLCNRVAEYLKIKVEMKEMFFADLLNDNIRGGGYAKN